MATGSGFDNAEFKSQTDLLKKRFAGMGQNAENKKQETGQQPPEREQNTFERHSETCNNSCMKTVNLDTD